MQEMPQILRTTSQILSPSPTNTPDFNDQVVERSTDEGDAYAIPRGEFSQEIIPIQVTHSNPTLQFHAFRRLPIEIQLRIWHLAFVSPRLVPLEKRRQNYFTTSVTGQHQYYEGPWEWKAVKVSDFMLVNRECRAEFKREEVLRVEVEERTATSSQENSTNEIQKLQGMGIRPEVDVVYLDNLDFQSEHTGMASPGTYTRIENPNIADPTATIIPIQHEVLMEKISDSKVLAGVLVLALKWTVFNASSHPPEWIIKSYCPKLKTLFLLLDDEEQASMDVANLQELVEESFVDEVATNQDYRPPRVVFAACGEFGL